MSRTRGFPENGELVVCTVTSVKNFGAFVTLDEYDDKEGFVHVRDVASGWVKYIRDFIREGQKIVCKVLGVDSAKGHIDLSLKSVNEHQKREKIQQWKNEKKADKLLEIVADRLSTYSSAKNRKKNPLSQKSSEILQATGSTSCSNVDMYVIRETQAS